MTKFDIAYEEMRKWEGGFSDDKYDPGGKTIWGISRRSHPETFKLIMELLKEEKRGLAKDLTKRFYRLHYWNDLYDGIPNSSLAFKLFDFGVNAGIKRAVKILQKTINKVFQKQRVSVKGFKINPLKVDGVFGRKTLYYTTIGLDLYEPYIKRLGRFYRSLLTFWRFGKDWMRRLKNRKYL